MRKKLMQRQINRENQEIIWRKWWNLHTKKRWSVKKIAESHINPATGRPYTKSGVYYAFSQLFDNN